MAHSSERRSNNDHHSTKLDNRVKDISFKLLVMAGFWILLGGGFCLMILYLLLTTSNTNHILETFTPLIILLFVLVGIDLFIVKIAFDFRAYKAWTFTWIRLLAYNRGFYFLKGIYYDLDFRRAFDQPEFEYPDHPEYGYKLEDKIKNKQS